MDKGYSILKILLKAILTCLILTAEEERVFSQTIILSVPDTICMGDTSAIQNSSTGALSHYWSYCSKSSINITPGVKKLNDFAGAINTPTFCASVYDGTDYYLFITNYHQQTITRAKYGNSLLNTPIVVNLGTLGGAIPYRTEGIEIRKENSQWIGFVLGSDKLVRLEFGTSLESTPKVVDLGNQGGLAWPHELVIFKEGQNWIGFTANRSTSSLTRFVFGNSLFNSPVCTNIKNIGLTNGASGIEVVKDDAGKYFIFATDLLGSRISRIEFGTDIMNTLPSYTQYNNIPSLTGVLRGIMIIKSCEEYSGFITNEQGEVTKMNFSGGPGDIITFTSLGTNSAIKSTNDIGGKIRVDDMLYAFTTDPFGSTITRLEFPLCSGTGHTPSSNSANPSPSAWSDSGTHSLSYTINYGEPNQRDTCFLINVQNCCKELSLNTYHKSICRGDSTYFVLNYPHPPHKIRWYKGTNEITDYNDKDTLWVFSDGSYSVIAENSDCIFNKQLKVDYLDLPVLHLGPDTSFCDNRFPFVIKIPDSCATCSYLWSTGSTKLFAIVHDSGIYTATVTNMCGTIIDTIKITKLNCTDCEVYIPNAFTPNGNSVNDVFKIDFFDCIIDRWELLIFDRWGEQLAVINDSQKGWDGKYKGEEVPDGVYMYILNYMGGNKILNRSGTFHVLH